MLILMERHGPVSPGFQMLIALGVQVGTVVLVVFLLRNQRMINKARSDIEFMKTRESTAASIWAARGEPIELEEVSTISHGRKYDKLPILPDA